MSLEKLDSYIIKNQLKQKGSTFDKLRHNKWFMIAASILVVQQTIQHGIDK
jgi:hypothetical protein